MHYDVIIIGAGPAGLFCASKIEHKNILILEKKEKPGKKLLVSGGGKCNFTNNDDIKKFITHYGDKKNFVKRALYNYSNYDLLNDVNFEYIITEEGKVFPKSMKSKTVLNWLINKINNKNNVEIKYNTDITSIDKKEKFIVKTNVGIYTSDFLVIATGGKSYPMLGSNGDGYIYAKRFNHTIIKPRPALSPVIIKDYPFSDLSGISMDIILRKGKLIYKGTLLFTHKGFSGPIILNTSRFFENNDTIKVSFVTFENEEIFRKSFNDSLENNKNVLLFDVLKKYNLTKRFIAVMFKRLNLDRNKKCNSVSKEERNKVINYLYNQEFIIDKVGDFNIAMVTAGGVCTKEINSKTMESKLVENLYFIGEVLDVDGDTGGYNIQWAFSSAKAAADNISKK
ncbi:BaiN/RdsA family NAD(P)/FAD-dependent oxidoreductase [Marinitoga aeolica]|uniref:NAD(P)/FAD-dependent oxidoreductase n=1 Tax=Marinitoga aeolica TaxID=2809031 RepID=A0ABY8PQP3_9BACT|nr:NAD(P)/FAD-dependent oxidoreductase [Marinitoga aeolica]WGS64963.1 NAD(P)/FAD-dependent oxidoreductase [Marinitoga aeolica]